MNIEVLAQAALAAVILEKLVGELILSPLWAKFLSTVLAQQIGATTGDKLWLVLIVDGALAWFTGLNGFPVFATSPAVGRVLTCLAIAAGASVIYDLTDKKSAQVTVNNVSPCK